MRVEIIFETTNENVKSIFNALKFQLETTAVGWNKNDYKGFEKLAAKKVNALLGIFGHIFISGYHYSYTVNGDENTKKREWFFDSYDFESDEPVFWFSIKFMDTF